MLKNTLQQILRESRYTVVLSGYGQLLENGYPAIRDGDESYDIETKYGYSTEEILSSGFYSTRKEMFFKVYREAILAPLAIPPGKGYLCLKELQDMGYVNCVITRRVFALPDRAGCENVINLHGTVYDNHCPRCGKKYPMEFIRDSKKVPLCTECSAPIRPGITLFGEMVDNGVITKAASELQKADVVLVLGTNLKTYLCTQLMHYYEGDKLIVINAEPHFSDKYADVVIHERTDDYLEQLVSVLKNPQEKSALSTEPAASGEQLVMPEEMIPV